MARRCYALKVGNKTYKLRLTLAGQKEIKRYDPDDEVIETIMSAVTDPEKMDVVLTQALSWDGNENHIRSGEKLYDEIVDSGNGGQEYFLKLLLGIVENAGLLTEDQRIKMERRMLKMLKEVDMEDALEDEDAEEETNADPLDGMPML